MMAGEIRSVSRQKVLNHMYCMICDICRFPVHRNCTSFTRTEYNDHINAGTSDWTCQNVLNLYFRSIISLMMMYFMVVYMSFPVPILYLPQNMSRLKYSTPLI